jgi:hypothetical protein
MQGEPAALLSATMRIIARDRVNILVSAFENECLSSDYRVTILCRGDEFE